MPYHCFRDPNGILNVSTQGNLRLMLSELHFESPDVQPNSAVNSRVIEQ
jgi:hypothetical protein